MGKIVRINNRNEARLLLIDENINKAIDILLGQEYLVLSPKQEEQVRKIVQDELWKARQSF